MISKLKNVARLERKQQKADAGLMSSRYPGVATIVISMDYYNRGPGPSFMQRTVNFFPGSAAYFHIDCMKHDCIDGGFNLEPTITTMVKGHVKSGKGEFTCAGSNATGHTRIDYKIAIQYNNTSS